VNPTIRDSSNKEVGWFLLSLGQRFLYLFDALSYHSGTD